MSIDLDRYIFIDNHAHSLLQGHLQLDAIAFRQSFTESRSISSVKDHLPTSVSYMHMIGLLSELLAVNGEEEILEYRARQGEKSYLNLLWDEASLGALIIDDGFRSDEMIDLPHLASLCGRPVYRCVRIEAVLQDAILQASTYDELSSLFERQLLADGACKTVALKTIAAYRGGLDLAPVPASAARDDFDRLKTSLKSGDRLRITRCPLYDRMLLQSFEWAAERGWPVQLHAGIGDDDADLRLSNPLCLREILKSQHFARTNFVFLHCYPFIADTAYLAALYPNVYMDLSLSVILAAPAAQSMIQEALAGAPSSKILAGSDGHNIAESHWYGVVSWKQALAAALEWLVEKSYVNREQAQDIAARILHENARELYRLEDLV